MINEEEFLDIRALQRQGFTYAEIGRLVGRDWRTVKRYLVEGGQPVYRRKRAADQSTWAWWPGAVSKRRSSSGCGRGLERST